ncbi:MAG: hypothetical protein GF364_13390 [Candidatus Lokiarchaeota archaeon]|nr:hypothetical protein [Candidatus Lokiarchaeota archaeon]
MGNKRFLIGFLYGTILGVFGVFIFSNFEYSGLSFYAVFQDMDIFSGLYQFFWLSFRFNFFKLFNPAEIQTINLLETFYPAFMGWFSAGLIAGTIVKGGKRGVLNGMLMVITNVILWLCFAVICGANVTFVFMTNIFETGGGILTGLISAILGGLIGGLISGSYIGSTL